MLRASFYFRIVCFSSYCRVGNCAGEVVRCSLAPYPRSADCRNGRAGAPGRSQLRLACRHNAYWEYFRNSRIVTVLPGLNRTNPFITHPTGRLQDGSHDCRSSLPLSQRHTLPEVPFALGTRASQLGVPTFFLVLPSESDCLGCPLVRPHNRAPRYQVVCLTGLLPVPDKRTRPRSRIGLFDRPFVAFTIIAGATGPTVSGSIPAVLPAAATVSISDAAFFFASDVDGTWEIGSNSEGDFGFSNTLVDGIQYRFGVS